jgi:hypothetical protein
MKNIVLFVFIFIFQLPVVGIWAQEIMVSEPEAIDSSVARYGPNRRHYGHFFVNFGSSIDAGDAGARIVQPRLDQFSFGYRYKLRLFQHLALGIDAALTNFDYRLQQKDGKILPNSDLHDKERMLFTVLNGGAYMRINVGRRGNQLGNYLDLGGYGGITMSHTHFTKDKLPDGSTVRIRRNRLDYYQLFNYGLTARLGFKKIILFSRYRLSDMFYADKNLPELPRITAGIEFVMQ